jgi:hypothetical protein
MWGKCAAFFSMYIRKVLRSHKCLAKNAYERNEVTSCVRAFCRNAITNVGLARTFQAISEKFNVAKI